MKVLDLQCGNGHGFEGWFGSEDDFQSHLARSLVECPLCGDHGIVKKLSAPRLNFGATRSAKEEAEESPTREVAVAPASPPPPAMAIDPEHAAQWLKAAREVLANTEDVGKDFAREARKIHYGECPERGIRGQASKDETLELLDEGVPVLPMPFSPALKGPLH